MFDDLDETVRAVVLGENEDDTFALGSVGAEFTGVNVSFLAPDEKFRTSTTWPAVNIFLYDVRENWSYRNQPYSDVMTGEGPRRKTAPSVVDCSYLISFWTDPDTNTDVGREHHALGLITRSLLLHRTIPAAHRRGVFAGDEALMMRGQVAETTSLAGVGEFWQAMGGTPRTLVQYTVTVALPGPRPDETLADPPTHRDFGVRTDADSEQPPQEQWTIEGPRVDEPVPAETP